MSIKFNPAEPLFDNEHNYRYGRLELTPNVMAHIVFQLCQGELVKRKDAIRRAASFHVEHGGVKKATVTMLQPSKKPWHN